MKIKIDIYKSLFLIYGFVVFFLSSCISPKETNLLQQRDPVYPTRALEEYRLKVNDEIYCSILTSDSEFASTFNNLITSIAGESGNPMSYVVYENGNISIPFFGEINVLNLTLNEAEQRIQRKMRESFPDAQVRVTLKNNIFYIVSNKKNGTYGIYKDNMTIYQALAISGNIENNIDLTQIKIIRTGNDGKDIIKTFNLRTESVIESEFYYIKPNDVIYYTTSKSSFFKVGSITSLVGTILVPVTFFTWMIVELFK